MKRSIMEQQSTDTGTLFDRDLLNMPEVPKTSSDAVPAESAVDTLRDAVACNATITKELIKQANSYYSKSEYNKAEELLDYILKYDPENLFVRTAKGQVLRYQKQYEEALSEFNKALEKDPHSINALKGKAVALKELGHMSEARATFELIHKLAPADQTAVRALAALSSASAAGSPVDVASRQNSPAPSQQVMGIVKDMAPTDLFASSEGAKGLGAYEKAINEQRKNNPKKQRQ